MDITFSKLFISTPRNKTLENNPPAMKVKGNIRLHKADCQSKEI